MGGKSYKLQNTFLKPHKVSELRIFKFSLFHCWGEIFFSRNICLALYWEILCALFHSSIVKGGYLKKKLCLALYWETYLVWYVPLDDVIMWTNQGKDWLLCILKEQQSFLHHRLWWSDSKAQLLIIFFFRSSSYSTGYC